MANNYCFQTIYNVYSVLVLNYFMTLLFFDKITQSVQISKRVLFPNQINNLTSQNFYFHIWYFASLNYIDARGSHRCNF